MKLDPRENQEYQERQRNLFFQDQEEELEVKSFIDLIS
jgi:hypothetical protein